MVVTSRVRLDRISSSTRNAALPPEVIVGDGIVAAEGYVLAVRILEDKSTYNTIEDTTGRMLALRAGELLARFPKRTIEHVPRELNFLADALVNRAIDDAQR